MRIINGSNYKKSRKKLKFIFARLMAVCEVKKNDLMKFSFNDFSSELLFFIQFSMLNTLYRESRLSA
jgi:hypothetical protein